MFKVIFRGLVVSSLAVISACALLGCSGTAAPPASATASPATSSDAGGGTGAAVPAPVAGHASTGVAESSAAGKSGAASATPPSVSAEAPPSPASVTLPTPPKPTTVAEAVKKIDLLSLSKLSEVRPMRHTATSVEYYAQGTVTSAAAFYRTELVQRGWESLTPAPEAKTELQYLETLFAKEGYLLKLTVGQASEARTVTIHLSSLGNVDARLLPVITGGESMNSGLPSSASYLYSSDVATVAAGAREILAKSGWREYKEFGPPLPANPQFTSMSFFQNGVILFAFVSSTPQFQNGKPTLSYNLNGMLPFDLAVPPDAEEIKLDTIDGDLEFVTRGDLAAVARFCRKAYPPLGWQESEKMSSVGPERGMLVFRQGKELSALIRLGKRASDGVLVRLERAAIPTPEQIAEHERKTAAAAAAERDEPVARPAQPAEPSAEFPDADALIKEAMKAAQGELKKALGGAPVDLDQLLKGEPLGPEEQKLVAEDKEGLPVPASATQYEGTKTPFRRLIHAQVPGRLPAVLEFYKKELAALGWKLAGGSPAVADGKADMTLTKNGVQLSVVLRAAGDEVEIELASRDEAAARSAGIVPETGKARLLLGNAADKEATVIVNNTAHRVAAGTGARNPADAKSLQLAPGEYTVTVKFPGEDDATENLQLTAGQTWAVIIVPTGGYLAEQLY